MALTKAHNRMIEGAPVNVLDFGATGDGVTDDTAAIQAAIDSLATTGGEVFFPSGRYSITGINVLTNSITLTGTGKAAPFNANVGVSSMLASVLVYASATGNAVTLGQTGASCQSCSVVNLSIWGNTTGYLLSVTGNHLLFDQLFLEQEGTGGGLYLSDAYQITARDIVARGVNVTPKKSSVGIWFDTTSNGTWSGGGSFKFERCNVSFFDTGYRMGADFDGSITPYGGSGSLCMEVCQAYKCRVGFHTSYLITQIDYNSCRAEECDTHGYLIDNSCAGATIRGGYVLHTGTVNIKESVRIGNDSGTAGIDKASHVLIDNVAFGNINNATIPYINVMGDSNVIDVTIQNCGFWKYLGYGVMLSGTVPTQVNIINNNFEMFSGRAILNQFQCVNAVGSDFRYEARFIDNFIETSGLKESEIQTVSGTPVNLNNAVGEFLINTSGASAIINLPASPNIGDTLKVIKKFGANTATITPQGGATIVGFNAANAVLTNAGDSAEIQYVQSGRWVIQ